MSDVEKASAEEEIDAETERLIYKITEGIQRLNSIGTVQFIQIILAPIPEPFDEELKNTFTSAIQDGLFVNNTIVLEQMESGDSFMRVLNAIRHIFQISKAITIEEIQVLINIDYKGEPMDIIVTYDPQEHDISLVSVSQKEDFFKILEYVTFFWLKSRPRI
ncbi:MAG: hypothetical protein K9W42_00500 [Candidatus Heimdallarchaeota archaeon]|nr:hypothetical protein [Candidatus Heimdallarchaeota archaeon]